MDFKKISVLVWLSLGFILLFSIIKNTGPSTIFTAFLKAQWIWLLPYLLTSFFIILCLVTRWYLILFSMGQEINFTKLFFIYTSGFSIAYLSPVPITGGEGAKAFLLNKNNIEYRKGLTSVLIDKSIEATMNVIFSIIGLIFLVLHLALPQNTILTITLGTIIAIMALAFFYYRNLTEKPILMPAFRALRFINSRFVYRHEYSVREIEKRISFFFRKKRLVFMLALTVSFTAWIFMFIEYKLLLLTFGYNAPISILFLVIAVVAIAYIVPIPAALGALEGGQVTITRMTYMNSADAVAFSTILRSRDLIVTFTGLIYLFNYGISFMKK
ncbi:MAG: lysylphosphatidylglycerol synthase transmembrane domain-containing protein [Candidatus Woesearchaeota archaeon]